MRTHVCLSVHKGWKRTADVLLPPYFLQMGFLTEPTASLVAGKTHHSVPSVAPKLCLSLQQLRGGLYMSTS